MSQVPGSLNVAMYIKIIFDQCKMCLLGFLSIMYRSVCFTLCLDARSLTKD